MIAQEEIKSSIGRPTEVAEGPARGRLLLVGEDAFAATVLAAATDRLGGFQLEYRGGWTEAEDAVLEQPPPRLLILDFTRQGAAPLQLLTTLETLGLRLPVLLLASPPRQELALPLSPFLSFLNPTLPPAAMARAVLEGVERAAEGWEGPLFRLADHLQLAVLFHLSVSLHLRHDGRSRGLVEVFGGEVWNVFAGARSGERALPRLLSEAPGSVEVVPRGRPPASRQIHRSGTEVLARGAEAMTLVPVS